MLTKFYSERSTAHPEACDATKKRARTAAKYARYAAKNKLLAQARAMYIIVSPPIKPTRYTGRA